MILWFARLLTVAGHFSKVAVGLAGRLKTTGTIALLFDDTQPETCAVFQWVTLRAERDPLWGENYVPTFVVVRNGLGMLHSL